jgi:hypothetical protein
MMPNITRGDRMVGLLVYLAGPGRENEHEEPHLVAGDSAIMAWHDDAELNRESAVLIGHTVDHPRRAYDVAVKGGSVWHCSLSLRRDEGALSDERWAAIAEEFVKTMGFIDDEENVAPCRWVAVRHGVSKAGNDHVHVVVSLVREDGTTAKVWNDRPRAQQAASALEAKHGLEVLESRVAGRGSRGVKPAEHARAHRAGAPETDREALARTVRACAAAADDEAEFVRRVRREGVRIRPRFAAGRGDVITGFSVAQRTASGAAPIWYGGGSLARDLTLTRLRSEWISSPQSANEAVAEWTAAKREQRPAAPGREMEAPDPKLWAACAAEVEALREQLRTVPADDRATWAHVARETSGAFAAWSLRVEATPGPLAATADVLARSAQVRARVAQPQRAPGPSARGAAMLLSSIAHGGRGPVAEAVLLRQLANTAKALHDAHQAVGEARTAAAIADTVRTQLAVVARDIAPPSEAPALDEAVAEAARLAAAGQLPARPPGSPVPGVTASPERPVSDEATKGSEVQR